MITGQIKNQIDQIWETFWTGGISNSITLLEQMTYLLFMRMLDNAQIHQENKASALGTHVSEPIVVDRNGFILARTVCIPSVHDSHQVHPLCGMAADKWKRLEKILVDRGYRGEIAKKLLYKS